ncbi:MAG: hypothetical protein COA67_06785 [Lutibacter sp.]|nr:MAG: hypothetical protein COA67_06785 [Lutibacter sp.]
MNVAIIQIAILFFHFANLQKKKKLLAKCFNIFLTKILKSDRVLLLYILGRNKCCIFEHLKFSHDSKQTNIT